MEKTSITSLINTAIIRGEKEIIALSGEHDVKKAFICLGGKSISLVGNGCVIRGESNVLDVREASDVTLSDFEFISSGDKDFTVRISKSKNVTFDNCRFSSLTGCIVISDAENVTIKNCKFYGENTNGICVLNASSVNVINSDFMLDNGESITVVDNKDGIVVSHNNSFKRCYLAIKSVGRNVLKITNNYFLTYAQAIEFDPSPADPDSDGVHRADIKYNLFDECCKDAGEATVVIRGSASFAHRDITITENIFSQKERAVINARGVFNLLFKENNVHTNDESTVENSIINGIKA